MACYSRGMRRPAPGMIAVFAGLGCALVAAPFARGAFEHWLPRIGIPILAAILGIVVALKLAGAKRG